MEYITPAKAGIKKQHIQAVLEKFEKRGINMHSILMARSSKLFFERYWEPFQADTPHRMYSVTKSFVSVAIGCLWEEGKIALDDPVIKYFPDKLPPVVHPYLQEQTIRDMLMMCTCFAGGYWFTPDVTDRLRYYFGQEAVRPAGTIFDYDSNGSYVLGCLVERVSGKSLLDYLKEKVLDRIGGFENACILETPDGTPWGDSALVAKPIGLMHFAQCVMHKGAWEGEQLLSAEYLALATAKQTDNSVEDRIAFDRYGYGYQFWMAEQGFAFVGMGGQFAICVPEKDFVFVCTGDNQLSDPQAFPIIFDTVFECIVDQLEDRELPEEAPVAAENPPLSVVRGEKWSPFASKIDGCWFECTKNPMGITRFRLDFPDGDQGVFTYINDQGEKKLAFGMKQNAFGLFPQFGYSDQRGNVHEVTDFRYRCAASGGWIEKQKLQLRVQIIDRYFGHLVITFGFKSPDSVGVRMIKCAEDFLAEYDGWMGGKRME